MVIFYKCGDGRPGCGIVALVLHTNTWSLHKRSPSNSCIHNIIFCLLSTLHPSYTHIHTVHRLYESVSTLSGSLLFAPLLALSPCVPSPTLFQWHRKTNAAPSFFARLLLPPFPWSHTILFILFLAGFYHCISICISQCNQPHSISISALSSLPPCDACTSSSLSFNHCWCCSAASAENWFCLQIHCMLLSPPLVIVHSITLPPSFSLSITPWEPTFFPPQCFMLPFPLPIFISVCLFTSLTLIWGSSPPYFSSRHIVGSQWGHRQEFTILHLTWVFFFFFCI